jgi:hypothetical protein
VGLERCRTSETERSQEKSTPPTPLLGVRMPAWAADNLTGLIIAGLPGTVGVAAHGGVDGSVAQFKRSRESSNQRPVPVVKYRTVHAVMVAAFAPTSFFAGATGNTTEHLGNDFSRS